MREAIRLYSFRHIVVNVRDWLDVEEKVFYKVSSMDSEFFFIGDFDYIFFYFNLKVCFNF